MAQESNKKNITHFGVEFKTSKHEHISLENYLIRNYHCSDCQSLAERIGLWVDYVFVERSRLSEYVNKVIDYYDSFSEEDFKNLSSKNKRIYNGMKILANKINDGCTIRRDPDYTINFDYYDLDKCILGTDYSDKYFEDTDELLKKNYEINMNHFKNLNQKQFDKALSKFLKKYKEFHEIHNLDDTWFPGCYIMVLDDYKQVYIGKSYCIAERIFTHWTKKLPYDRRIFMDYRTSKISIDSFGCKDTTRIFVMSNVDSKKTLEEREEEYVASFPNEFLTNRVPGGLSYLSPNMKKR